VVIAANFETFEKAIFKLWV